MNHISALFVYSLHLNTMIQFEQHHKKHECRVILTGKKIFGKFLFAAFLVGFHGFDRELQAFGNIGITQPFE